MTCVVCGQGLIEAARAPRQPDRHRWCSDRPGRHVPAGLEMRWVEPLPPAADDDEAPLDFRPVGHDLTPAQIEARFAAAKARLRRAS